MSDELFVHFEWYECTEIPLMYRPLQARDILHSLSFESVHCTQSNNMGRARRNQRDDIRKRRALKRKKIIGESDEVDSSLAKILRQRNQQESSSKDDTTNDAFDRVEPSLESKVHTSNVANSTTDDTHANSECTHPINEEKTVRVVKPLDNIERMRLRKRERKAKRRAKKEKQLYI